MQPTQSGRVVLASALTEGTKSNALTEGTKSNALTEGTVTLQRETRRFTTHGQH